jgi:hypothetical protein
MKKINQIIQTTSFEAAKEKIAKEDVEQLINGPKQAKFAIELKRCIALLVGLIAPFAIIISYALGHSNMPETTFSRALAIVIAVIFIIELLYHYFKKYNHFKNANYQLFMYASAKTALLSYMCGSIGNTNGNYFETVLSIGVFIPMCLLLYFFVERNMVISRYNEMFQTSYRTSKVLNILLKLSGILLFAVIAITQLYRLNKWWLNSVDIKELSLGSVVTFVVAILFFMLVALIPTYIFFDSKLYLESKLLKQYSEEFRLEYSYSKEEWYWDEIKTQI